MAHRELVTRHIIRFFRLSSLVFILAVPGWAGIAVAHDHGKIRIYNLNSKGQEVKQRMVSNPENGECYTSPVAREISRFAQIGYDRCRLYSKDECEAGSEITAMWGERKYRVADIDITQPQTDLLRGTQWVVSQEENIKIRSWYCEY